MPRVTYSGLWKHWFMKCFGLNVEYANVEDAGIKFNSSVFPNGIRPEHIGYPYLITFFHLPNQFPVDLSFSKYSWPKRTNNKAYWMSFNLQQVEVLKKRNKRYDPCLSDSLNYDQEMLEEHLERVGCRAFYQKSNKY